jgi:hypothetical protein
MRFEFERLQADLAGLASAEELVARTHARFSLTVDDRQVYERAGFPVLALAVDLTSWAAAPPENRAEVTIDTVRIHREADGWQVSSSGQALSSRPIPASQLDLAVRDFANRLADSVRTTFGAQLEGLFWQLLTAAVTRRGPGRSYQPR